MMLSFMRLRNDKCKAIAGLIDGGNAHLEKVENPANRDLMMIAHCLRIEYNQMAAYQITSRLAQRLGITFEMEILTRILSEEEAFATSLLEFEPVVFEIAAQST